MNTMPYVSQEHSDNDGNEDDAPTVPYIRAAAAVDQRTLDLVEMAVDTDPEIDEPPTLRLIRIEPRSGVYRTHKRVPDCTDFDGAA